MSSTREEEVKQACRAQLESVDQRLDEAFTAWACSWHLCKQYGLDVADGNRRAPHCIWTNTTANRLLCSFPRDDDAIAGMNTAVYAVGRHAFLALWTTLEAFVREALGCASDASGRIARLLDEFHDLIGLPKGSDLVKQVADLRRIRNNIAHRNGIIDESEKLTLKGKQIFPDGRVNLERVHIVETAESIRRYCAVCAGEPTPPIRYTETFEWPCDTRR